MAANGHLTLLPFGRKWSESGDVPYTRMDDLLVQCGADPQRILAASSVKTDLDPFLKRNSARIWNAQKSAVIIGFTGTRTVGEVFETRGRLEKDFPFLLNIALWILFLDPERTPFFLRSLEAIGSLSVGIDHAAIWTPSGSDRRPFLVLTPQTNDENAVRSRVEHLRLWRPRRPSGMMQAVIPGQNTSPPPASGPAASLEEERREKLSS